MTKEMKLQNAGRVEIETSVPFESVREAANQFGGIGFWKPSQHKLFDTSEQQDVKLTNTENLQEQAAELEKGLFVKERETFEVLKELEATKLTIEELKSKLLQKEAFQATNMVESRTNLEPNSAEEGNFPAGNPGLILMVLNQAKSNLSRNTHDLTEIRSSVHLLREKLDKERTSFEKTRERLKLNSSRVSLLEKELNETEAELKFAKDPGISGRSSGNKPSGILKELQRLRSEAEDFKKMGENARSMVVRAMSEIEQMKSKIKAADIRFASARKTKEAARAAEAVFLAEIKAVTNSESLRPIGEVLTMSFEEYSLLTCQAKDAEEKAEKRVEEALIKVDEVRGSEKRIQKIADQADEEIRTSKKALEEALERVEAADNGKLEAEELLRLWRSDNVHNKRRSSSVHNRSRFKNPSSSQHNRESHLLDVNGLNLITDDDDDDKVPVLKPTLSIGQILSRKLVVADECEVTEKGGVRQRVSLGQMLRKTDDSVCSNKDGKEYGKQVRRKMRKKKFGLGKLSVLLNKDSKRKKKKKSGLNLRF